MINKGGVLVSDRGSIRALNGEIFDADWKLLFTPQNNFEFRTFIDRVEEEERVKGKLSAGDLDHIVSEFNK